MKNRQTIRLHGYNYSLPGTYFVTICTKNRKHLFGEIKNGKMLLNEYGEIVNEEWQKSAQIRKEITLGEYIIMPNHIHGIIFINESFYVGATGGSPTMELQSSRINISQAICRLNPRATRLLNSRATRRSPLRKQQNHFLELRGP